MLLSPRSLRALSVVVVALSGFVVAAPSSVAASGDGGTLVPLRPTRLLDTRDGTGGVPGAVAAGSMVRLQVAGAGGVPSSGAAAVALNVTVTDPTSAGYVTAYAGGQPRPGTSNLNFAAGQTVANAVVVPVGADGSVALYDFQLAGGTTQLVADVTGYVRAGAPTVPGAFAAVPATRILDTRNGPGPVAGGDTVRVQVAGRGGVPAAHVGAVIFNLTATEGTASGYVTAYPDGLPRPGTSNVNYVAGQTVPNLVVVPVGADGQVNLYSGEPGGASVQLVADVTGYFLAGTPTTAGAFGAVTPTRLMDTRNGTGVPLGAVPAGGTVALQVAGLAGVPRTVAAVALNLTATEPSGAGFVTVYPDGVARPVASAVNYVGGQTVPNTVVVPVGADGRVDFYTSNRTQLVADVAGYFEATGTAGPSPAVPAFDHVVVAVMENKSVGEIIGNRSAPYINALARSGADFTQSYAITHPSEPNYLALFAGSTQGLSDDSCPHAFSGPDLADALAVRGKSFVGYSESLPAVGYSGCSSGAYARKHAPWVDFPSVPAAANRPFSDFPSNYDALPAVSFVVPNLDDDMHDGTVAAGDSWLRNHLDGYVQWASTHNSLFILTFDEDDNGGGNHIATVFAGAHVSGGTVSERIDHYRVLRTIEDAFAVVPTGHAAGSAPITDIWR